MLPARVEIALAAYDVAEAREAAEELRATAATIGAPMLQAAAHQALGATFTYEEDAAAAIAELRKAVRVWNGADAPSSQRRRAAGWRSRTAPAATRPRPSSSSGRPAAFEGLGAVRDAERCEMIRAGEAGDAGRRVVRTFMFTDIVGSTDLVRTMGDEAWEGILRWHDDTPEPRSVRTTARSSTRPATGSRRLGRGRRGELRGRDPATAHRPPGQTRVRA